MTTRLRTFVLRPLSPKATPTAILTDLQEQFHSDLPTDIITDEHDTRRFYLRFESVAAKRIVLRRGFTVCGTKIKPQHHDFAGCLPHRPPYASDEEVLTEIAKYGEVTWHSFRCVEGTSTRVGGLEFHLQIDPTLTIWPTSVTIGGTKHRILDQDDRRQCSACKHYGHLRQYCRQSTALPSRSFKTTKDTVRTEPSLEA